MASQQAPPSIPPRPVRDKSPNPQSASPTMPSVPPRPTRPARSKTPSENVSSGAESPFTEPQPTTIPSSTELHAPVAVSGRAAPIPKAHSEASTARSTATNTPAPGYYKSSTEHDNDGIPQIGRRVPMHPNAGDVQAPTPSATPSNNRKKHVYREEWEMDEGAYGASKNRTPYSMSSTDLNAVVAHSESLGSGSQKDVIGVPDEELGYIATEQYAKALSRAPSRPDSPTATRGNSEDGSGGSNDGEGSESGYRIDDENVIHVDEPGNGTGFLRRGNSDYNGSSIIDLDDNVVEGAEEERETYSVLAEDEVLKRKQSQYMQAAISHPSANRPKSTHRSDKSDDGHETPRDDKPTLALSTKGTESRYRTPYEELSPADENAKPLFPDDEDGDADNKDNDDASNLDSNKPRNKSVDDIKRPGLSEQHRFPSNDVWEEAPEFSQLQAIVDSPPAGTTDQTDDHNPEDKEHQRRKSDEPELEYIQGQPRHHYEPGDEQAFEQREKQGDRPKNEQDYSLDLKDLPEDSRLKRLQHPAGEEAVDPSARSSSRQKFPSNDIWEDNPPSLDLETSLDDGDTIDKSRATTGDASAINHPDARPTTGAPLEPLSKKSEIPARPHIPARPQRPGGVKLPQAFLADEAVKSQRSPDKATPPRIPDRPKPAIPSRPANLSALAHTPNEESQSVAATAAAKPGPAVPPRKLGSKIAALTGSLGDLESKLKMGFNPTATREDKPEEKEDEFNEIREPVVLSDARKVRARGPRGRKPPTKEEKDEAEPEPAPVAKSEKKKKVDFAPDECVIVNTWTVFTLDEDLDAVVIDHSEAAEKVSEALKTVAEAEPKGVEGVDETAIAQTTTTESSETALVTEKSNPTAILGSEHPEDALQQNTSEVEAAKAPTSKVQDTEGERPS